MDELNQGFTNDLSKTFDDDETFGTNTVTHFCKKLPIRGGLLFQQGEKCPHCGEIVREKAFK